jgi:dTDP-4-dehydrorhamnose reductase
MKFLLLGKDGQIGSELHHKLCSLGKVVALDFDSSDQCGDLTDLLGLAETVRTVRPTVIVNAAGYTAVDKAEGEPDLARLINATAPGLLAQEAEKLGAWLVHYSTDYVFDGGGDQPWAETDSPNPLNVYGKSKLEGDRLVAALCTKHLIFRTSWVYAVHGENFAKTMLCSGKERERLKVIDDQIGAPTGADLIADITCHALRQVLPTLGNNPTAAGIYHVSAGGYISWYDYACFVIETARNAGMKLKVRSQDIDPISTSDYVTSARRPKNSRLNTTLFQNTFGMELPHWQDGVTRMLTKIIENQS